MTNTPAGWYPDSERPGQQRYWDGSAWTEHRAPGGPASPAPSNGGGIKPPDDRPWFKKKRFIIPIVLVVLMAIGGIVGEDTTGTTDSSSTSASDADTSSGFSADEEPAEDPVKTAEPAGPHAADVSANAADMIKEFEDNELQADAKYKGKWIEVSGVVNKIDTEMFNSKKYVLNIGTGSDWDILTVACHDMPQAELASLTKGDSVKIIGEFDDGGDLGVQMKKCRLS